MASERLVELFRKLGAPDPEGWAESQEVEDIPQLARFVFLRQAWRGVLAPDDPTWIGAELTRSAQRPDAPGSGAGHALRRLLAAGADTADLTELVRTMQWQVLHHICYLLSDPEDLEEEIADLSWSLMQTDREGNAIGQIGGLYESLLETDPAGNEMRPKRGAV